MTACEEARRKVDRRLDGRVEKGQRYDSGDRIQTTLTFE